MSQNYAGVIIEESLEDKSVLQDLKILETKVKEVTESHKTPWVKQLTAPAKSSTTKPPPTASLSASPIIN